MNRRFDQQASAPTPRQDWDAWPGVAWPAAVPATPPAEPKERWSLDWATVITFLVWGVLLTGLALFAIHATKDGARQRQAWLDNGPRIEAALNARYEQEFQYHREYRPAGRFSSPVDAVVIDGVLRPDCRAFIWNRDTEPTLKCDQPVHLTEAKGTP